MIPKILHYCWFGGNPLPKLAKKCIKSWEKFCPDYEIRCWDESNVDISACPLYVQQAYEAKKWAFVTDYIRLLVVHQHGGIYMDTDVELLKSPNFLLCHTAYFGFERQEFVSTGLGFGAEKNSPILRELMDDYQNARFLLPDGSQDLMPCPKRNTAVFVRHGLKQDGSEQLLDGEIRIFSNDWFCPMHYWSGKLHITPQTVSIHWYSASWHTPEKQKEVRKQKRSYRRNERWETMRYFPNRVLRRLLGNAAVDKLKQLRK